MQAKQEQIDPCTVKLHITVESEQVEKAYNRAYNEFSQFTNVPGFRPGKAPRPMLERYVNQARLQERVKELVAARAYRQALKDLNITEYAGPEGELPEPARNKKYEFELSVPTPPVVTVGGYKTIEVERQVHTITDDEVESAVRTVLEEHARLQKVDDRGVRGDDVIIAEALITPEGVEMDDEPQRKLIRLGNNIPGFDEAVTGMKIDEEKEFTLTYPEDYQEAAVAGKPARFHLKVLAINERVLPDLTDDWVRRHTRFHAVQEFRDDIRAHLQRTMDRLAEQMVESRILTELVKRSEVHFPQAMLLDEMQEAAARLSTELQRRRMSYEDYLVEAGITEEEHRERLAMEAASRLQQTLILTNLARQENITVTSAEIDSEINRQLDERDAQAAKEAQEDQAMSETAARRHANTGPASAHARTAIPGDTAESGDSAASEGSGDSADDSDSGQAEPAGSMADSADDSASGQADLGLNPAVTRDSGGRISAAAPRIPDEERARILADRDQRSAVASDLLNRKLHELLFAAAKITDVPLKKP